MIESELEKDGMILCSMSGAGSFGAGAKSKTPALPHDNSIAHDCDMAEVATVINSGHHEKMDWKPIIEFVKSLATKYPNKKDVYIRAIYLIHNILVEEEYPKASQDTIF
jgi:hypothetical protein